MVQEIRSPAPKSPPTGNPWLPAVLLGLALLFVPLPGELVAQSDASSQDSEATGADATDATTADGEAASESEEDLPSSPLDGIDQILEEDEAVLAGAGYSYSAGDRRDPFKSPVRRRSLELPKGPRPEGRRGLLIEELTLTGVFDTPQGRFAQVRGGGGNKSYLLQQGDELYDGDVVGVSETEVVFKQIINDPAAIKPFREVVKRLTNPSESSR
ncbi:MAG: hypothetical protein AAGD01_07335 [Acidobacteriota bacterium]